MSGFKYATLFGTSSIEVNEANIDKLSANIVNGVYVIDTSMTTAQIQAVISNTAVKLIKFKPGLYTLTSFLNINRSDIVIDGNGATLKMGNNVLAPIFHVGIMEYQTTAVITNVTIRNFILDGNNGNQAVFTLPGLDWITISGIFIYRCIYVSVENCLIESCKLNGISASNNSYNISVKNTRVKNCDGGITFVDSYLLNIEGCTVYANSGSGIYMGRVISCIMTNNLVSYCDYGVDVVDSSLLVISSSTIHATYNHGIKFTGTATVAVGVAQTTVSNCSIFSNYLDGIYMDHAREVCFIGNSIYSNGRHGIELGTTGDPSRANYQISITSNSLTNNFLYAIFVNRDFVNTFTPGRNLMVGNTYNVNKIDWDTRPINAKFWTIIDSDEVDSGKLVLNHASGFRTTINPMSQTADINLNLPTNNGSTGQYMRTDGSGNMYWDNLQPVDNLTVPQKLTVGTNTSLINWRYNGATTTGGVTSGGAASLPAAPAGYVAININGATFVVPYYSTTAF